MKNRKPFDIYFEFNSTNRNKTKKCGQIMKLSFKFNSVNIFKSITKTILINLK